MTETIVIKKNSLIFSKGDETIVLEKIYRPSVKRDNLNNGLVRVGLKNRQCDCKITSVRNA